MTVEQVVESIETIVNRETLRNIEAVDASGGLPTIRVDLHGLAVREAKRLISNIIAMTPFPFVLDLIHGYHRGTAIKDMIQEEKLSYRITSRQCLEKNPGRTLLNVGVRYA